MWERVDVPDRATKKRFAALSEKPRFRLFVKRFRIIPAMQEIILSTHLNAPADRVWNELQKPQLLLYVAHPMIRFSPVEPEQLSEQWEEGEYVFKMTWRGILPLGKQVIGISYPAPTNGERQMHDNGHSALIKRWDHLITIKPQGSGTQYTDRVEIDAGLLTPIIAAFAQAFYSHRQRRWQRLVAKQFDYGNG